MRLVKLLTIGLLVILLLTLEQIHLFQFVGGSSYQYNALVASGGSPGIIAGGYGTVYIKHRECGPEEISLPGFTALDALIAGNRFFFVGSYNASPALVAIRPKGCGNYTIIIRYIPHHEGTLLRVEVSNGSIIGLGYMKRNSTYAGLLVNLSLTNPSTDVKAVLVAGEVKGNLYLIDFVNDVFLGGFTLGGNYVPCLIKGGRLTAYVPLASINPYRPEAFLTTDQSNEVAVIRKGTLLIGKVSEKGLELYRTVENVKDFKVLWRGDGEWYGLLMMNNGTTFVARSSKLIPTWCPTLVYVNGSLKCLDSCLRTHEISEAATSIIHLRFDQALKPMDIEVRWISLNFTVIKAFHRGIPFCTERGESEKLTSAGFMRNSTVSWELEFLITGLALMLISYIVERKLK